MPSTCGAFHGAIARTTPYGSRSIKADLPSSLGLSTLPFTEGTKPPIVKHPSTARLKSKSVIEETAPVSTFEYLYAVSLRCLSSSAAFSKTSRLCDGFVLLQVLNAFCADATAFNASCSLAAEHFQHTLLSFGEVTSKVFSVVISLPSRNRGTVEEGPKPAWDSPFVPFVCDMAEMQATGAFDLLCHSIRVVVLCSAKIGYCLRVRSAREQFNEACKLRMWAKCTVGIIMTSPITLVGCRRHVIRQAFRGTCTSSVC